MKIAIHHRPGSFSDQWVSYCDKKGIDYKLVNAFDNDIIQQVIDCNLFMWHHHHDKFKDVLAAKNILFALEHAGIKVFPNFKTGWHFDDKVAQKYLLEAIRAPLVPSYIFYDKQEALNWVKETNFPKVFKLKGGAGSSNVKLVKTKNEARKLIKRAFGYGFSQFDKWSYFKDNLKRYQEGRSGFLDVLKGFGRLFIVPEYSKKKSPEREYVYFQDFLPNNGFDVRVVVVYGRAFAEKRYTRKNDFRASGSGVYSYQGIDRDFIKIAFDISNRLGLQSGAFDFIYDHNTNKPMVIELSYGFGAIGISKAPGYWDRELNWHKGKCIIQEWMLEKMIEEF